MNQNFRCDILGVGSPILDLLARVNDPWLAHLKGAKGGMELVDDAEITRLLNLLPLKPEEASGGAAANTAVVAARLGLRVGFLGKLGDDEAARRYEEEFLRLGLSVLWFKRGKGANARCLSLVTPDGQRTLRTCLGAAMTLTAEEIRPSDFTGVRHAHIEGYLLFNRDLFLKVLESARQAGCSISLDLGSFEVVRAAHDLLPDVLQNSVDVVLANEDEAAALFDGASPETAVTRLTEWCPVAAVKWGAKGAWVANRQEKVRIQPVPIDQVLDTTGAGDAWAGGFLYGWLNHWPLAACGALASRTGAEAVRVLGAGIPDDRWADLQAEVQRLRQEMDLKKS